MTKSFVNLHAHSYYSLLQASPSPKEILKKAKKLNCPAVALTDTGVGYGLIEFLEESLKSKENPKAILGAELYIAKDSRFERRSEIDGKEGHVLILAQNKTGYENLLQLISKSHLEGFFQIPRIDFELLEKHKDGLIAILGGTKSALGKIYNELGEKKAEEFFEKIEKIFQQNCYLEIIATEKQKQINQFIYDLSKRKNKLWIVSSDTRFLTPDEREATEILFCIGKGDIRLENEEFMYTDKNNFQTFEEIESQLEYIPKEDLEKARLLSLEIAKKIEYNIQFEQNLLPHFLVEEGENESSQLRKLCKAKIPNRYSSPFNEVEERLHYELSVIEKMGFSAYFLIVSDFIQFAKDNGIAVGPGRGSAAGSIVAYLLGITNIDPIKYELLFERFLNPERISMPDIDIDFSDERRDEVLQYVIEKYGIEKVSKVCTFGTLSAKAALKDVGRALGVPFTEMNAFTKILPSRPGFELKDALEIKEFKTILNERPKLKKVFDIAQKLEGCVRHVSVHACAVIIGNTDLSKHSPLQWAPGSEDIKITQFPYKQLEHLGLLKMDFLGLKNLSVLEKTIQNIKNTTGETINLDTIPIQDQKTFTMIAKGDTTGVFQFESTGMRRYLKELQPTEFEDLVAMNALYRPGPMEYIPVYIKGKHHHAIVKYMHETFEPILKKTYGIAVYQEQVLKIAQVFAGFSLGQADILRKAIGKKILSILEEQRKRFIDGAIKKGHDEKLAIKIFDEIIVPFSGYGFNRSHAVCYARIAYETAYLRANYPHEFMAAMMTTDRSDTKRIVFEMNECRSMEIEVLPPSINESGAYFTVITKPKDETQSTIIENTPSPKKIRFGLSAIKGMGEETVKQIIFERNKNGKFKSLQDFAKRVPAKIMNKKTLEALSFSGALDTFANRKSIVESLEDLAQFAKEHQEKYSSGQIGLFGNSTESTIDFTLKNATATREEILKWERESLGLFVSDHPLKGFEKYLKKYGKLIGTISEEDADQKKTIHGIVTHCRNIITRAGKQMAILEIEDTSGKIEVAIFPQMYEKVPKLAFQIDTFVRIRGKIEKKEENINFIPEEIKTGKLNDLLAWTGESSEKKEKIEIHITSNANMEQIETLKKFLETQKNESTEAKTVQITFQGKSFELPYRIKKNENTDQEIQSILKK